MMLNKLTALCALCLLQAPAWAQEADEPPPLEALQEDPNVAEVRGLVQEAKDKLADGKKKRGGARLVSFKEALKTFSRAWRSMTGLQIESAALSAEINSGFDEIFADAGVQRELKELEERLTALLSAKDYSKAYDAAEELHQLNSRSREYDYMMRVLPSLLPR
jgi:Asp-tRNA(Asn)/Glu-tRNA(Gln) amidotransferase A subunit family amidase